MTAKGRSNGSPWVSRRWRRNLAGVGGGGGDALGRGRRRGGSFSPDERRAAPGAARRGEGDGGGGVFPFFLEQRGHAGGATALRRPRVEHEPVVLASNKSRETFSELRTDETKEMGQRREQEVVFIHRNSRNTPAAMAISGELWGRPGGAIRSGARGEMRRRGRGLNRAEGRAIPATNSPDFGGNCWRIRGRFFRLEVDDDDVSDDVIQ